MIKILWQIEMTREFAFIILEDLNLEVNKDYGQKVGLAVVLSGSPKDVLSASIKVTQRITNSNSV